MIDKIAQTVFGIFYSKKFYENILKETAARHYMVSLSVIFLLLLLILFPKDLYDYHHSVEHAQFFKEIPSFNIESGKIVFKKKISFDQIEKMTEHNPLVRFMSLRDKASIIKSKVPIVFTEKSIYWNMTHTFSIIFPYRCFHIQQINSKHILQAIHVFFFILLAFDFIKVALFFLLLLIIAEKIDFLTKKIRHSSHDYFMLTLLCFIPCCVYMLFLTYYPMRFEYQYLVVPLLFSIYFFVMRKALRD